ncbi:MAG: hypothetical protein OEV94_00525 [Deltaproteobacteria bacterium]|nr:hypothetical protein [Deltaproteobacteria bacterium]
MKPKSCWMKILPLLLIWAAAGSSVWGQTPEDPEKLRKLVQEVEPARTFQVTPQRISPDQGVMISAGVERMRVESKTLGVSLSDPDWMTSGMFFSMEWVWSSVRFGYVHQSYRHDLPAGTLYQGVPVSLLGFDSDQFWVYHGFRPSPEWFLGYGVALQNRVIKIQPQDTLLPPTVKTTSGPMAGLITEYAFYPPFAVSLRLVGEGENPYAREGGVFMALSAITPF